MRPAGRTHVGRVVMVDGQAVLASVRQYYVYMCVYIYVYIYIYINTECLMVHSSML